jgi:hypothetical protein
VRGHTTRGLPPKQGEGQPGELQRLSCVPSQGLRLHSLLPLSCTQEGTPRTERPLS